MLVDLLCPVYNGARFLPELLESLDRQTHAEWRLWVRDDGSTDDSERLLRAASERDPRIRLPEEAAPRERLGAVRGFARLLAALPPDSRYVMFVDQDDVWLPRKVERTVEAMTAAEAAAPEGAATPILVHTDLTVVDERLAVLHPSFWASAELRPRPDSLRALVVENPVTGAAAMINRALLELAGHIPEEAAFHDWWCALAAQAFGRIVAVPEATLLYRQHGGNVVGARQRRIPLGRLPAAVLRRLRNIAEFRRGLASSAAQAGAFLERYGPRLEEADRRFLRAYAELPERGFVGRKLGLLRLRRLPGDGVLRTLGLLLRG